jgi:hypothetical protein
MERRLVKAVECRTETAQRTVIDRRRVPEIRQVKETVVVMVPEIRSRTETYQVARPVWRDVERTVVVPVPYRETRSGVRQRCRQVLEEEFKTVWRDQGSWEEVVADVPCIPSCGIGFRPRHGFLGYTLCDGYGPVSAYAPDMAAYDAGLGGKPAAQTYRVWKPKLVPEQVPVKVWRTELVDEPFEYQVTVFRPEERTVRTRVCDYVPEEKSREVRDVVCVPTLRTRVRNITTYNVVEEPRVETFAVRVPYEVEREIEVPVCRMVPKTVVCRVPISGFGGCPCCAS